MLPLEWRKTSKLAAIVDWCQVWSGCLDAQQDASGSLAKGTMIDTRDWRSTLPVATRVNVDTLLALQFRLRGACGWKGGDAYSTCLNQRLNVPDDWPEGSFCSEVGHHFKLRWLWEALWFLLNWRLRGWWRRQSAPPTAKSIIGKISILPRSHLDIETDWGCANWFWLPFCNGHVVHLDWCIVALLIRVGQQWDE